MILLFKLINLNILKKLKESDEIDVEVPTEKLLFPGDELPDKEEPKSNDNEIPDLENDDGIIDVKINPLSSSIFTNTCDNISGNYSWYYKPHRLLF